MGPSHGALCRAGGDVAAGTAAAVERPAPRCPRDAASLSSADRFTAPVVTIWEANRSSGEAVIGAWKPGHALVGRPFSTVEVRRLPPGGYAFLEALRTGGTIGDAAEAGCSAAPSFDLAANVRLLAERKIA